MTMTLRARFLLLAVAGILPFLVAPKRIPEPVTASVARGGAVHQLRVYEIFDERREVFHRRFRDHAMRIMERYGFHILATWESKRPGRTEFVYLLEWPDTATMRIRWTQFLADTEWIAIKRETGAQGRLVGEIEDRTMWLTPYSPTSVLGRRP
ncbi:MAG TPA: NIPSNAP family protein [Gemmatimonadaceae bacterium]|nr:NIPSNAP family protein [Gemmatimonadaceae bacterium]